MDRSTCFVRQSTVDAGKRRHFTLFESTAQNLPALSRSHFHACRAIRATPNGAVVCSFASANRSASGTSLSLKRLLTERSRCVASPASTAACLTRHCASDGDASSPQNSLGDAALAWRPAERVRRGGHNRHLQRRTRGSSAQRHFWRLNRRWDTPADPRGCTATTPRYRRRTSHPNPPQSSCIHRQRWIHHSLQAASASLLASHCPPSRQRQRAGRARRR